MALLESAAFSPVMLHKPNEYRSLYHFGASPERSRTQRLPVTLNGYSCDRGQFRRQFYPGGEIEEQNGKWVWQPEIDSEWEVGDGFFVSEEHWAWDWKPDRDGAFEQWFHKNINQGHLRLTSTLSSALYIGLQSAVLAPPIRWRHLFDPVVQTGLRRYARFLTGFFGGSCAIYVPDDVDPGGEAASKVSEGWKFDQIVTWLHEQMAPATSIFTEELIETYHYHGIKGFRARGYYLDDFADLSYTATTLPVA